MMDKTTKTVLGITLAAGVLLLIMRRRKPRYVPGSLEQVALFTEAAARAGLPTSWASSPGLANILRRESDGWVGRPNFTYGDRAKDKTQWPAIWAEIRRNYTPTRSSATGLGQMIVANVDKYYPSKRAGIGDALEEAIGMLKYIRDRYGTPENAWAKYGTLFAGY